MKKIKKNCVHTFEVIEKVYDHWDKLTYVVIFCKKCGLIIKKEV